MLIVNIFFPVTSCALLLTVTGLEWFKMFIQNDNKKINT